MTQTIRHLIITSDISTWKFDRPVLFLGKWCLREQDRDIWENMDAVVAEPIGAENQDRLFLHLEARRIESKLFSRLVPILNDYHNISRDERYWKILLGHWLREIVQLLLNRITTMERCINQYRISGITLQISPKFVLAFKTYSDIWTQSMNNSWNTHLYAKVLELIQVRDIAIEKFQIALRQNKELTETRNTINKISKSEIGVNLKARRFLDKSARHLAELLGSEKDAFVVNSYLPSEKEVLLNLALGQFPQRRTTLDFEVTAEVDRETRLMLGKKLSQYKCSKIEGIIASLLFDIIPINYLEGYKNLVETSEKVPWPKKPRFIFTSNNFVADEIFKIWTAEKVNKGIPYFVGQHGNGYGTHKFLENTIEEVTSDKFLTWGWEGKLRQHTPAYIFKNASSSTKRTSEGSGILLIECNPTVRFVVWDQADEFDKYMSDQFAFVSALDKPVKESLLVRLHSEFAIMQGEGDRRWFNFDRNVKLDFGRIPVRKVWLKHRLVVHSYDSTGILETLEANRPTLAFWQNGLNHLVDEAIPFYELLIGAGIVHLSPESAAAKINEVWGDLNSWWQSSDVQNAREVFCHEYARTSKKPIRDLKKLLLKGI